MHLVKTMYVNMELCSVDRSYVLLVNYPYMNEYLQCYQLVIVVY